jgi:hypothetical protein
VNHNGVLRRALAIDGNDQTIETSVRRVAAKLALATFYEHHGPATPQTAKINTMWTHNQSPHAAPGVAGVLGKMPRSKYLSQGKLWDTQDTFFVRYYAEPGAFFMAAILHESLALMAHISDGAYSQGWMAWHRVWKPAAGQGSAGQSACASFCAL